MAAGAAEYPWSLTQIAQLAGLTANSDWGAKVLWSLGTAVFLFLWLQVGFTVILLSGYAAFFTVAYALPVIAWWWVLVPLAGLLLSILWIWLTARLGRWWWRRTRVLFRRDPI